MPLVSYEDSSEEERDACNGMTNRSELQRMLQQQADDVELTETILTGRDASSLNYSFLRTLTLDLVDLVHKILEFEGVLIKIGLIIKKQKNWLRDVKG